ncbi:hypothetical protein BDZ89DRAFT_1256673 [Hymenopellis radicata]|nr:hypothetical protein BDZ89DRAFT_1256673 [Hymenopellis radicata]
MVIPTRLACTAVTAEGQEVVRKQEVQTSGWTESPSFLGQQSVGRERREAEKAGYMRHLRQEQAAPDVWNQWQIVAVALYQCSAGVIGILAIPNDVAMGTDGDGSSNECVRDGYSVDDAASRETFEAMSCSIDATRAEIRAVPGRAPRQGAPKFEINLDQSAYGNPVLPPFTLGQEEPHRRLRHQARHQARHEQSNAHRQNLYLRRLHANATPAPDSSPGSHSDPDVSMEDSRFQLIDSGMRGLLGSLYDTYHVPTDPFEDPNIDTSSHTATYEADQNFWNLQFARDEHPHTFDQAQVHQEMAGLTAGMLDIYYSGVQVDSDFKFDAPSDSEYDSDEPLHEIPDDVEFAMLTQLTKMIHIRARPSESEPDSPEWYPWKDKIAQLDLFLWLLSSNDTADVPSVRSMKTVNERLQKLCGIDTIILSQIITQEMANPKVREHLSFFPEDSGKKVSEAFQAQRWLDEFPDDLAPPMIRKDTSDYFIFEPTILNHHREEYCLPVRWFRRGTQMYAECWKLQADYNNNGWLVIADEFEVHEQQRNMNFLEFCNNFERYNAPDPRRLLGVVSDPRLPRSSTATVCLEIDESHQRESVARQSKWSACAFISHLDATCRRSGTSIIAFSSRRPALNDRKLTKYNIHFLCTSNLAAPLEMLDGIADHLAIAEEAGIEAWDCHFEEEVLVIPWVVALLGDNPMQMMGKTRDRERGHVDGNDTDEDEEGNASDDDLNAPKKRSKFAETYQQPGTARKGAETVAALTAMFNEAALIGSETRVKGMRTASGVKDTYQDFFIQKLFQSHKSKRTQQSKADALRSCITSLPDRVMSPVWRLQGLDPHRDTSVEILHVVLLGFVKYMWQDVLKVQLNKKQSKLDELEHKLSSFDTSGLGIPALNGRTLVKYGLSLTGRDFRAIAQVAPFVLRGLISAESYETWLCLSKLIPIIWQTEISDIDVYVQPI